MRALLFLLVACVPPSDPEEAPSEPVVLDLTIQDDGRRPLTEEEMRNPSLLDDVLYQQMREKRDQRLDRRYENPRLEAEREVDALLEMHGILVSESLREDLVQAAMLSWNGDMDGTFEAIVNGSE